MHLDQPSKSRMIDFALLLAGPLFGADGLDESKATVDRLDKAVV